MSLKSYHKKRDFKHTIEPKGADIKTSEPIFVIQKHAASHLHYDLRLAIHGVLKSWAVPKGPCLDPSVKRLAIEVEDHPLEYATFEGEIPQHEYGGGSVIVWDYGKWQANENLFTAYKKGSMLFTLHGHKLLGKWKLIRLKNTEKKPQWLLIKVKDEYTQKINDFDVTIAEPNSVLSHKTLKLKDPTNIKSKKSPLPGKRLRKDFFSLSIKPELASLSSNLPQGNEWIYEIKFDGYRILAFINKEKVKLISRNNQDWTLKFPTLTAELKKLKLSATVLDGEVVILDKDDRPNFQLLQNSLTDHSTPDNLHYFVFDLPIYQNEDLTELPLIKRKEYLASIKFQQFCQHIHYTEHLEGKAETLFKTACHQRLEGLMAKAKDSPYRQTRTTDWLKLKCHKQQEFIVLGFTEPSGSRQYFGSLLLGFHDKNNRLIYAGHVGTGFNQKSLKMLYGKLQPLVQTKIPLAKKPQDPLLRKVNWVKPQIIVEVKFTEWTDDGILRHPSFQGLRTDKHQSEISQELSVDKINTAFNLTHPDKILYPKVHITKLDLANYYEKIATHIIPYILDRPLSIVRCPEGSQGECFFQKHWTSGLPEGLIPVLINNKTKYISVRDKQGVINLAQLAILEIHPWASLINKLDYPNQLIFDLDPDTKISWQKLVKAALIVHDTCDKLKLKNFIKLTGGKGLHIVIPLNRTQQYDEIKSFAKLFAEKLSKYFPKIFTSNMSKQKRIGKIFIDYLRNEKEATAIAPFSPRRDDNASIAVPISWEKLINYKSSKAYNIKTIDSYFDDYPKDPWKNFFNLKQIITNEHSEALKNL